MADLALAVGAPPPAELPPPQLAEAAAGLTLDEALMSSPTRFFNRELSWLAFNQRVLDEAENPRHPLLERLRFLSISANNLDEFFMVRVAGLQNQVREGVRVISQDGLTPGEQLQRVSAAAAELMASQQRRWKALRGELAEAGLVVLGAADVDDQEREWLRGEFASRLFPILTPLAIDPAHPFPFIPNLGFSLALKLRRRSDGRPLYALIPVPTQVKRFWNLPDFDADADTHRSIPLEAVLALFTEQLFPGMEVEASGAFRVIRDSDIEELEEAEDLVREFTARLKQRRLGSVVRLTIEAAMPADLRAFIIDHIDAEAGRAAACDGMLGLAQLSELIPPNRPS
jgi:polyphosphate kinase